MAPELQYAADRLPKDIMAAANLLHVVAKKPVPVATPEAAAPAAAKCCCCCLLLLLLHRCCRMLLLKIVYLWGLMTALMLG